MCYEVAVSDWDTWVLGWHDNGVRRTFLMGSGVVVAVVRVNEVVSTFNGQLFIAVLQQLPRPASATANTHINDSSRQTEPLY